MCSEEQGTPGVGQFMRGGNYLNLALWVDGAGSGPRKNRAPNTCWRRSRAFKSSQDPRSPGSWLPLLLPVLGQPPSLSGPQSSDLFHGGLGLRSEAPSTERQAGQGLEKGCEGAGGLARAGLGGVYPQPRNQFLSPPQVLFCPPH